MNTKDLNHDGSIKKIIMDLWIALRPLSLSLAVASTTLGILMAKREGYLFSENTYLDIVKIILVTIAGMSVLGAANLINDFYEGSFKYHRPVEKTYRFLKYERTAFDLLVFALSISCLLLTAAIGLILMYFSTYKLIFIGAVGIIGAYAYTGEPFVYKKRGLGAVLSLILVGSLMVEGSYMVFSDEFSWGPIIYTLPAALTIPLMMMSNELRDYERDKKLGIKTLTVLMGRNTGRAIYITLILLMYILTAVFAAVGKLPWLSLLVLLTIPTAISCYKKASLPQKSAIKITNILHIGFNLLMIISLILR